MANFDVSEPEYSSALRKLETTDRGHADVFNALFSTLINNDEFLKTVVEALATGKQDAQAGKGLSEADYTAAEKQKLSGIADNANNYTHPPHAAKEQGLYLITVDEEGHVSAATAVTKGDITALGIASAEAATLTAGHGMVVTQAADGSKTVAQKGARVYVGEDAPDPDEYDIHVW